ncbi:SafA/ExsA family spore coat assembly protein [Bacillus carboniphilus]|uniref:SafA/ExsA family spore coat assembly protein n=1 Tax=Bacillus carboniphilus TaxID=86663 RepID=A0ABN0W8I9_9BACI
MKKLTSLLIVFLFAIGLFTQPQAASAQTDVYYVKPGDTLWKIAVRYQIGLSQIISANPQFENPHWIYPGQKVYIPNIDRIKAIENEVIRLTNQERAKNGLPALQANWELSRIARYKSKDMRDRGYFAHNSPTYGSPFDMIRNFGVNYRTAGENIAAGQRSASEVVKQWMESPGHRQNILNASFKEIGVGYAEGGTYGVYWTQMFIAK